VIEYPVKDLIKVCNTFLTYIIISKILPGNIMVRTLQIYIGIHIHKGTDKCFNICLKVCYEKFKILRIVVKRQFLALYSILLYIFF